MERILIIAYRREPASVFGALYLPNLLWRLDKVRKEAGGVSVWEGDMRKYAIDTVLIDPKDGSIREDMFKEYLHKNPVDIVVSINLPRFCFGPEFGRVPTFITWVQDWCSWMTQENAGKWKEMIHFGYNDWMLGHVGNCPMFAQERLIECPFLMPHPMDMPDRIEETLDIVAPMNKGGGWEQWWDGDSCQNFLKDRKADVQIGKMLMNQVEMLVSSGQGGMGGWQEKMLETLGEPLNRWLKSLGDNRDLFQNVILENGILSSMLRGAAVERMLKAASRGDMSFFVAGFGWPPEIGGEFISPQNLMAFMKSGRYVLHVSNIWRSHHRIDLAQMLGRTPLVLSICNTNATYRDPMKYFDAQQDLLRAIMHWCPKGERPIYKEYRSIDLGLPATITLDGLENFMDWQAQYGERVCEL